MAGIFNPMGYGANNNPGSYGNNYGNNNQPYSPNGQAQFPQPGQGQYIQPYPQSWQTQAPQSTASYAYPQQQYKLWDSVDGEVGAKAYQLPQNWPPNTPMHLWDINEPVIYFKSINESRMPYPLQKVRYTMEDIPRMIPAMSNQALPSAKTNQQPDMSQYVRRDEIEQMEERIKSAILENRGTKNNGKSAV